MIVRGEMCDNPFYERPELALSDDNQTRLNWQLRQLLVQHRAKQRLEVKTASAVAAAAELAVELSELRSSLNRPGLGPDRAATGVGPGPPVPANTGGQSPARAPGTDSNRPSCFARPAGIWPRNMHILVNTGGGDAPGLNAVIRAVTLSGLRRGWKVTGIRRGYHGLLEPGERDWSI